MILFQNLSGPIQASHLIATISHPLFFLQKSMEPPLVYPIVKKYLQATIHSNPHECVDWKDTTMKNDFRSADDQ